jgi:hypothetical protein
MDREALDQATRQSISDLAKTMAKREKVNLHSKEGKPLRDEYEQRVLVKLAPNARIALDQLAARPTLGAAQAYVGVIGSIQKGQVRGDTNHPDNFHAGLKKLANSGPHWESFDKEDREDFVRMWVALRDVMPEAFWVDLEKFSPAKKGGLS